MRARTLTWWCCLPTILGCSALAGCQNGPDPAAWAPLAAIAEAQRLACPEADAADKAVLGRLTSRPKHWRQKGATKGEVLAHIDRLELTEVEKALAAQRVLAEFERCRGGAEAAQPTS